MPEKIYLVDGEEGYSDTNDKRMADALVSASNFKIATHEEYKRVKRIVDEKDGTPFWDDDD